MPDDRTRRHQSQTDRDITGMAARRERQRGVPEFISDVDDLTGTYDGEELARARAKRPTDERIARVEKKQDEDRADHKALAVVVTDMQIDVAGMRGELKVLPELVALIKGQHATEHETKRQGMAGRTKVIIAVLGVITTGLAVLGGASLGGCA